MRPPRTAGLGAVEVAAWRPAAGELGSAPTLAEDEVEWVKRARGGDVDAFRCLYDAFARRVLRAGILPIVRDPAQAEDLLSETFVRAMEHLPRFEWQGKGVLPWLLRIARNLSLDYLRRARRWAALPEDADVLPDPHLAGQDVLLGDKECVAIMRVRIAACLEALKPRYARVLQLRLVEQRSRSEAAQELQVSLGTLDVLLHRACRAFRRVYEGLYGPGSPEPAREQEHRPWT